MPDATAAPSIADDVEPLGALGPVARMLGAARPGSFVELGTREVDGILCVTAKLHIPGRATRIVEPLALRTVEGHPLAVVTGLELVTALLEAIA